MSPTFKTVKEIMFPEIDFTIVTKLKVFPCHAFSWNNYNLCKNQSILKYELAK